MMFNYKKRKYVVEALEIHVAKTGLGVLYYSKVIDYIISAMSIFFSNYGMIRHLTEAFNYGFT